MSVEKCERCNINQKEKNGRTVAGSQKYYRLCNTCRRGPRTKRNPQIRFKIRNKKSFCEFVAVHRCQLDVDHKDGNSKNNLLANLQTLCANCHRLKTLKNRDVAYQYR